MYRIKVWEGFLMNPKAWLSTFCTFLMILVALGVYRRQTGRESNKRFFILVAAHALTLFSDIFYWALDGKVGGVGMSIIFVAIYTLCSIMLTTYHYYLRAFWKEHYGINENWRMRYFPIIVMAFFILLWVSSFFNHIFFVINPDGSHYYTKLHPFSQTGILLILLPDFLVLLKERKKMGAKNCLFWLSLPLGAVIVRYFDIKYDLPFVYPTIALFIVGIFTFVNVEMDRDVEKKMMEVRESMGKVMVSQIQPHFLYNVLNSISILCRRNPERASAVTDKFAQYLRW
ncbi:MAG: histidine kinase, partial [Candidatus Ornithospirochaeta sp.]